MIFLKMEAIFGQTWLGRHSSAEAWQIAKEEWAISLGKYSSCLNIVYKAFEALKNECRQFPPNLTEFLGICRRFEPQVPQKGFYTSSSDFLEKYHAMDFKEHAKKLRENLRKDKIKPPSPAE